MKTNHTLPIACLALALASSLILHPSSLLAQGTAFTYQGRLNDGASPANGVFDFQSAIYDSGNGPGLVAGPLTNSPIAVSNGLFTVTLDFGAGVFTGADRWLDIGVRTNGGGPFAALAPRQQLTPTPYALYAPNAGTATSANSVAADTVGTTALQSSAVTSDKIANGTIMAADVNSASFSNTFWKVDGNAGTTAGTHFLGTTDNQPVELKANNARALRLEPKAASPNLIGGYAGNTANGAQGGFIGGGGAAGAVNSLSNNYATIGGGHFNAAGGLGSFIGGGSEHKALGSYSMIAGGYRNNSSADYSAVVGGVENSTAGSDAFVGAGGGNHAGADYSAVVGGMRNKLFGGDYGFIGGGYELHMSGGADYAVIAGGKHNTNTAEFATISGGATNEATAAGAVIGGGSRNQVTALHGVVGGGYYNLNWDTNGTIAGGSGNRLYGGLSGSTIGGGLNNIIDETQAGTIAGGIQNHIYGGSPTATVGGGYQNFIEGSGFSATIAGGYFNLANVSYSAIGGGYHNTNSGSYSAIPGGSRNRTLGEYSFAAGRRAKADHDGSFVWADDTDADFASTGARQFLVRAGGGVGINTNNPQATLHVRGNIAADALRAPGAGVNTGTFAFIHRAAATNISGHITTIYHPLSDGDPNAILMVTHNFSADTSVTPYETGAVGVWYNGSQWTIYHENTGVAMPVGRAFNVLIVKP